MSHRSIFAAILLAGFTISACSAPSGVRKTDAADKSTDAVTQNVADYEDFDVAAYPDTRPSTPVTVEHDVPEALMNSSAGEKGAFRRIQGYRIQIYQSLDKSGAILHEEAARAWWRSIPVAQRPAGVLPGDLPVYVTFQQPYYRVRVGNFDSLQHAERALTLVSGRFPSASIVVDRVLIRR